MEMTTSYAFWNNYDVDKELLHMDTRLEEEERVGKCVKAEEKLLFDQNRALENVRNPADALASKIAVAILKLKNGNCSEKQREIDAMRERERFLRRKAFLYTQIAENRSDAKTMEKPHSAIVHFRRAIKALNDLNEMKETSDETHLFRSLSIALHFDIGSCEMALEHFAEASEAFKKVLLQDDTNLQAWRYRGRAFERMGVPLLAMLHWERVGVLEPNALNKETLHRVIDQAIYSNCGIEEPQEDSVSSTEYARRLYSCLKEGEVLQSEEFHLASIQRFQKALTLLSKFDRCGEILSTQLAISCHLNAISGYLAMQRSYTTALNHCQEALQLDPQSPITHFRTAQTYQRLYHFALAMKHFTLCREFDTQHAYTDSIRTEMSRCEYERSQYDLESIRSAEEDVSH